MLGKTLELQPLTLAEANAFILKHHRHHGKVVGHKFSIGVNLSGLIVGVAVVGRPVARMLDDGWTAVTKDKKHSAHFELLHDRSFCDEFTNYKKTTVEDVIEALDGEFCKEQPEIKLYDISEVLKEQEKDLACDIESEYIDDYSESMRIISFLKEAKKLGNNKILVVGFGDNHGVFCGDDLGHAMDYEGRNIRIKSDDLCVITQQDR